MGLESIEGTDFGIRSMCENALKCMKWLSTKMKLHAAWHSGRAGAHTQEKKKKKKAQLPCFRSSKEQRSSFLSVRYLFIARTMGHWTAVKVSRVKCAKQHLLPPATSWGMPGAALTRPHWTIREVLPSHKTTSLCDSRWKACPLTKMPPMIRSHYTASFSKIKRSFSLENQVQQHHQWR